MTKNLGYRVYGQKGQIMDRYERIKEVLDEQTTEELIEIHNRYCEETNNMDDEIFGMDMFDEICDGRTPTDIAQSIFFGDFNPNHSYFCYNGYANFVSFDYSDEDNSPIYTSDIARWIDEHEDALDDNDVQDLLDEWEEENEEESEEEE